MSPLKQLQEFGQSPWLDDLRRGMFLDGRFRRLMDEDGICGITSNPTILAKAILETDDYREPIARLATRYPDNTALYEALLREDIRLAADTLMPVYESSGRSDGLVSLEISPELAHDTTASIREALRLWQAMDRPNIMIKIPATDAGLPVVRELIALGINVNATLIFSPARYVQVAEAWQQGLTARLESGQSIEQIASVASFFVSRIETLADRQLAERIKANPDAARLRGKVAVAAAKLAYREYQRLRDSREWRMLLEAGARVQRPLWASTSTKNPEYSDIKYVEALIGPDTVTTLPLATIEAYRDHGQPAPRLTANMPEAEAVLADLNKVGIDFAALARQLETEGVAKFIASYRQLLAALSQATSS